MRLSKHHEELDENGEGKCSVPMWMNGMPAGFCDKVAYGTRPPGKTFFNYCARQEQRVDGKYNGYVPGLACSVHGGPKGRYHKGDPCIYCGTPHDDVEKGFCPGKDKK